MWPGDRYNRANLQRDIGQRHRVIKTVFTNCSASYRTHGPDHLKPVGETEWAITQQGTDGICAGIVGHANMYLGPRRGLVFETWLYFNQLGDMKKLARAQPGLRIVTYKRIAAGFSPDERTWVFEKTARTVYTL